MSGFDLPDGTSEIFFALGLDDPNQLELAHEIRFYAHAFSHVLNRSSRATSGKIEPICLTWGKSVASLLE